MENVLKSVEKKIEVKVKEKVVPSEFFKDRKGLYIWGNFTSNVLSKAEPTEPGKEFNLTSFELNKSAYDEDIEKELPKEHIFSETDVCAIIADLIEKQPNGEEGILLNSGYANLFYTPSRVVDVGWDSGSRGWGVDGWRRDSGSWDGGDRVFSPATEI